MISMMLSEVANNYGTLPQQYLVYAIYDTNGRCCYVGMTHVACNRMRQHIAHLTNVKTVLHTGEDLRVEFYTKQDIDSMFVERTSGQDELPEFDDDKEWAEDAEWYLCRVLHPYLNVRKGWPGELARVREFLDSVGLFGHLAEKVANTTLATWNPPFDQNNILQAFMGGANSTTLAKVAGIEFRHGE